MPKQPQYQEIWKETKEGQRLCALINGELGFLMYLRHKEDSGFSSRNPNYKGPADAMLNYQLNNGQQDELPLSWALPVEQIYKALDYFEKKKRRPPFIVWNNDSNDEEMIN